MSLNLEHENQIKWAEHQTDSCSRQQRSCHTIRYERTVPVYRAVKAALDDRACQGEENGAVDDAEWPTSQRLIKENRDFES